MKIRKHIFTIALIIISFGYDHVSAQDIKPLEIGSKAPSWKLMGVDDKDHRLSEYVNKDILMIVFTCNHCPESQAAEWRLKKIVEDYKDKSFQLVAISPNNPKSLRTWELGFTVWGDSFEDMKVQAERFEFNFPYLYDGETQETTMAYGALSTPHCFVFDKERKLRYQGMLDDSRKVDGIKTEYARNAIDELFAGKPVTVEKSRSFGCSTKWLSLIPAVEKDEAEWGLQEVTLETIDVEGIKKIASNSSGKLRLINIWATWCGPCVAELPDLVYLKKKYQYRSFEVITISIDDLKKQNMSLAILKDKKVSEGIIARSTMKNEGRTTNNYIWDGGSLDELAEALDPDWPGPIPYTILIAPGGKILYQNSGEFNSLKVREEIISYLGRFR